MEPEVANGKEAVEPRVLARGRGAERLGSLLADAHPQLVIRLRRDGAMAVRAQLVQVGDRFILPMEREFLLEVRSTLHGDDVAGTVFDVLYGDSRGGASCRHRRVYPGHRRGGGEIPRATNLPRIALYGRNSGAVAPALKPLKSLLFSGN